MSNWIILSRGGAAVCLAWLGLVGGQYSHAANIETDFTTSSNPGNGWSHGVDNGTVETLFSHNEAFSHADASSSWTWPPPGYPPIHMHNAMISKGATTGHWNDTMTSVAGQFYHVWSQADHSAVIGGQTYDAGDELFSTWEVDVAGSYDILAVWTQPVDETDGSQTIDVLVNGSSLGSKSISAGGSGSDSISSSSVALSLGDTVSFRTTPSDPTAGMIALDATVTLVPEPNSIVIISLSCLGLTIVARRRRR